MSSMNAAKKIENFNQNGILTTLAHRSAVARSHGRQDPSCPCAGASTSPATDEAQSQVCTGSLVCIRAR